MDKGTDGRFLNSTSDSPRCPDIATIDPACERSRQARLREEAEKVVAAEKATFIKSTYTDKGMVGRDCAAFITEKGEILGDYLPPPITGTPDDHWALDLCEGPRDVAIIYEAADIAFRNHYKEFLEDLKAMGKTEYGTLFVLSRAETKIQLRNDIKACAKRLFNRYVRNGQAYQEPSDKLVEPGKNVHDLQVPATMIVLSVSILLGLALYTTRIPCVLGKGIIYDGRAPLAFKSSSLDTSSGPYLTAVKGSQNASYVHIHYSTLLNPLTTPPTPLWNSPSHTPTEQALSIRIDNSSIFVPGGSAGTPQRGFRRTELIAQRAGNGTAALNEAMETGITVFHFSIMRDERAPLNYAHEYQVVFVEPGDGSHVFGVQLGTPFNTTTTTPAPSLKILNRALTVLFDVSFTPHTWHNLAVQVDWTRSTLAVFYSRNADRLAPAGTRMPLPNASAAGLKGEFHFGVLKLPLVDPRDAPAEQGDVVHHGVQEGTTEGLIYSGVFVERAAGGVSVGGGAVVPLIS
ncbi:hypothetical protein H0H81_001630 [Sphagnurus paluster]|uniref:Glycoside hydrolase 131 catalytic N-terminal domain-containing protein n=1 Tax=Sphagnurus paluster TaxID=117069 RepID=A0A9P7KIM2_9AGAR|nr:hypothetical protein H0H81_001630 [Sphagnurus paluster]